VPGLAAHLTPRTGAFFAFAVLAAAVAAERAGGPGMPEALGDLAAGLALLIGGAVTWVRRRRGRSGALMVLTGATWFVGDIFGVLLYAHRGPLVHLLLTYPSGHVRSRTVAVVIAAAYVDGLVPAVARSAWATIALATAVVAVAAWRHRAAGGGERRARGVALAGALAVGGALALAAIARLAEAEADSVGLWAYQAAVGAAAVGLAADRPWTRWGGGAVTGLVVDLGDRHEPRALRAALARTLGDPGLEVAYRVAGTDGWIDEAGRPVRLPVGDGTDRAVTLVCDEGNPVAALVHDRAVLADRGLVASATAAARLAVANVRMQAEIAARVREVAASRRRLVEAGDGERRRLGDQLRTGAEQRVVTISDGLAALAGARDGEAAATLGGLVVELDAARADLRRFAHGIHPRALTEQGLGAALAELAALAAMPVTLAVPDRRCPPTLEAAAFFVCSEALANVAKYAAAARVDIAVSVTNERLVVRVADDGGGGADPARGSGLRGLADRMQALGGDLRVDSPPGAGTRLRAELPIPGAEQP
jgi:signal transduction histidine kinase